MATVYEKKNYTESDAVKQAKENLTAQNALKPATYQSKWAPMAEGALNDILNRKDFQYDVNGDALYQQYKDRYVNLGQQAMMDTMGQAAQLTGGYGNSYAQMAGQQAYHGYLQGLTDKIPELYQLAMDRHNQQGQDLYNKYGLLSGQEQQDYGRYNDLMNAWLTERDYLAGRYDTERGYDYGAYRDTVGDDQWKAQFDEDIRRFDFANNLGEFAPVPTVVSSTPTYTGNPNPQPVVDPTDKSKWEEGQWEAYIGAIAETDGSAAAGREMSNAIKSGLMPQQYAPLVQMAIGNKQGGTMVTPQTTSQNNSRTNKGYSDKTRQKYYGY